MKKIMIIDDSSIQRKAIVQVIRRAGYQNEILEACDGREAIDVLGNNLNHVSVVLCDCDMPNMSGIEFIESIAQIPQISNLPVVMVMTEGTEERIRTIKETHPNLTGYITKPFTPDQLKISIENFIKD